MQTEKQLSHFSHFVGQYPAIDRLLARKQAINKLHGLRGNVSAATLHPSSSSHQQAVLYQAFHQQHGSDVTQNTQQAGFHQLSKLHNSMSRHADVLAQGNSGWTQHACSQQAITKDAAVSDLAHHQYSCFRIWRQQRYSAAVTVQRHVRGLLARRLSLQMRYLNKHHEGVRQRMLSSCLHMWRCYASSRSLFRYTSRSCPISLNMTHAAYEHMFTLHAEGCSDTAYWHVWSLKQGLQHVALMSCECYAELGSGSGTCATVCGSITTYRRNLMGRPSSVVRERQ